jgi:UDP-N-acetylglucosamine--N-acetylmuramyl-(pentapeptide) pyrophosphoryl-undecaprenol N-acetylglucosamine transferase
MTLVVLAAGGTGGHMFPAQALASEILARGHEAALLTDSRGAAFANVPTHRIRAARLGGGLLAKAVGAGELLMGAIQSGALLRRMGADVVVGFGGYPSVPPLMAAARLSIPTVIHEQNALLGRANRLLAGRARRIATGFPAIAMVRGGDRARLIHTGNPVRAAIQPLSYEPPCDDGPFEILVLGGSQGARVFSDVIPAAIAELPERLRRRLRLSQQARPEDEARVTAAHAKTGVAAEVQSFFDDVPERLARAHLVVCRSGASTCAELTVAGRPAIFVPYPHAADDHQRFNAEQLVEAGAGWLVPEPEMTPMSLAHRLAELAREPQRLAAAADAAAGLGRPDAAQRLADLVLETAGVATASPEMPVRAALPPERERGISEKAA